MAILISRRTRILGIGKPLGREPTLLVRTKRHTDDVSNSMYESLNSGRHCPSSISLPRARRGSFKVGRLDAVEGCGSPVQE